ncbi:hypothetical protein B4Q13_16060, partial [Lacticaseibacillus rhamnosus]
MNRIGIGGVAAGAPLFVGHISQILDFTEKNRLPTMFQQKRFVVAGGLMTYGVDMPILFRRGAVYVHRILQGAKPADLPIEQPTSTTYKGYTVYKQGFGSQGPSLLQTLNILENFDLRGMGHNSVDYIHTLIEAMKLSYADRDTYYADQAFVKSPGEGLLSKAYAKERAAMIDPERASRRFVAGNPMA